MFTNELPPGCLPDPGEPTALDRVCEDAGFLFAECSGILGFVDAELTAKPSSWRTGAVDWHLSLTLRGITQAEVTRGVDVDEACLRSLENFVALVRGQRRLQCGKARR